MREPLSSQIERLHKAKDQLFAEAKHLSDISYERLLFLAGGQCGRRALLRAFPGDQFLRLRCSWIRERVEQAMVAAFSTAQVQSDVTLQQIATQAGCSVGNVSHLVGGQFHTYRQALATPQQHTLHVIEQLVEDKIPLREYTWKRISQEAGRPEGMYRSDELTGAFRAGREALIHYHKQQQQQRTAHATYASLRGDWINVDESVWYLPALGRTLRRDHLRSDFAALAWPLLREQALLDSPSAHTLFQQYHSCIFVAKVLGDIIPDIRTLTLETLQQAWLATSASKKRLAQGRTILMRILEAFLAQEAMTDSFQMQEYARAIHWLEGLSLKEPFSLKAFLSETEFDAVLHGCLEDIIQGISSLQRERSAGSITSAEQCSHEGEVVLYWGIALFILIMAFTGLRRQSIVRLCVEDLAQIGPHAFALAWRHGKPRKERIAIIPALVAEHIQQYIHATASIRDSLGTRQIFLARNRIFRWDHLTLLRFEKACHTFVHRHELTHENAPLRLGSTLLRRTYVTRALYEFPSIAALQAQLGHNDSRTTLLYAQHDRYVHPAHVDNALDTFGRKVLVRWHRPLVLDDLPETERQTLLGGRAARSQEVGLCRYDGCVKLDEERLPPCSLCEHLVSGPEYLTAWEREKVFREQQLEQVAETAGAELLYAQMKGLYDRFLINYHFIQERRQA